MVNMDKPTCICGEVMAFIMDSKQKVFWGCPKCGRLLLRAKDADWQEWYSPEAGLKGDEKGKIVVTIKESDVQESLEEYGYEVTNQRIADILETIATSRYVDTDEIIRAAIETLADEQDWQMAEL